MDFPHLSVAELDKIYRNLGLDKHPSGNEAAKYKDPDTGESILLPNPHRSGLSRGLQNRILRDLKVRFRFTEEQILLAHRGKKIKRNPSAS